MTAGNTASRPGGGGAFPLLSAKMSVPRIRVPVVLRPRLLDAVSAGTEGPLTVVTAAAGSGKTCLLASWVARGLARGPIAWFRLDSPDDEPGAFWGYVVESLRRAGVPLPDDVGVPIRADDVEPLFLARLASAIASHPQPVILVLDEFGVVSSRAVVQGLETVLRNAEPVLRLVLLSRTAPALAMHRHRLAGEVVQVTTSDLAFTREEAADLLRQHGVQLNAAALDMLTEHTRGWAAGLRMSALSMQRRVDPDAFVASLPGEHSLAPYLVDEVLNCQTPDIRDFLLRTSITDRVCPGLANTLSDRADADILLPGLVDGNVLTEPLAEAPGWYQYHPLFAQVLRGQLRRERPELLPELHRRASIWFERAGLVHEAVDCAVSGGDWQRACRAVVGTLAIGKLLAGRETAQLTADLAALPEGEPGAAAAIIRAATAIARFDSESCRTALADAEEQVRDTNEAADHATLASIAVIRAVLARALGDADLAEQARAEAERHLAALPGLAPSRPDLTALLLSSVASAQMWVGRFADAERTLRDGLAVARNPGCEYPRLNILERLAWIEFRKGHLRRAAELGQSALQLADTYGLAVRYRTGAGHLTLAMVAVEWNDRPAARQHLDNAEKTAGAQFDPFVATVASLLRAWQYANARDFRRSSAALAPVLARVDDGTLPPWIAARVLVTSAAVHLRHGDLGAALATLDRAGEHDPEWLVARAGLALAAGDRDTLRSLVAQVLAGEPAVEASKIESLLLLSRAYQEDGNAREAREALRRALELARPEGYRRPFADAGPWLKDVLRASPDLRAEHRWLGPPLTGHPAPARQSPGGDPAPALIEPLTERERTVLTLIAQAKSTEDIAAELFLSVNTVKTHRKHIHRKLSVARHNDAVRRGRQLGLV